MDATTIETYDRLAKEYDEETTDFWERFPRTSIDAFAAAIGEGKILDIGSGPGLGMIEGEGEIYKESMGVQQPRLFAFYSQEELESLLHEHGFEIFFFEAMRPRSSRYMHFVSRKES